MRFDPSVKEPLVKKYPIFQRRAQYFDDDRFLRFLIYLIAPDSPAAIEREWEERVLYSLEMIGEDNTGPIYERFSAQEMDVQEQMFQLFIIFGDFLYEEWLTKRISFAITSARLRDPLGLKDTDRLRWTRELSSMRSDLLELESKLFPNNEYLKSIVTQQALDMSLSGYAEQYALTIEEVNQTNNAN